MKKFLLYVVIAFIFCLFVQSEMKNELSLPYKIFQFLIILFGVWALEPVVLFFIGSEPGKFFIDYVKLKEDFNFEVHLSNQRSNSIIHFEFSNFGL